MATNYVDYDYWTYGYGDGDLSSPDVYVLAGYWDSGDAENEGISATITGNATVSARGSTTYSGIASITGTATVTASGIDLDAVRASITGNATVTANGIFVAVGKGSITGNGTVTANGIYIVGGRAVIAGNGTVDAIGSSTAYEWTVVTPESTNWARQ